MKERARDDGGATLVLVLIFIGVFGLVGAALLGQTTSNFGRSIVTKAYQEKVYAADAGVDATITDLRADDTLCPKTGSTATLPTMTVNGKSVVRTCETLSGNSLGANGYALIATDGTVKSFETQSGGGGVKKIGGSVFVSRLADDIDVVVDKGSITEHTSATSCSTGADRPANLLFTPSLSGGSVVSTAGSTPVPPYSYSCSSTVWSSIDPGKTLPTTLPTVHSSPLRDAAVGSGGSCYVFRPGTYTSGITFGTHNYLGSGVYYFPSGDVRLKSQDVVAGAAASGDSNINGTTACATDADVPTGGSLGGDNPSGTGATIILGGNARLLIDNPGGVLEIYTRTGGAASESGSQNVSVMTVPSGAAAGWTASTRTVSDPVVQVGTGSTPAFAAHGMLYMPSSMLDMNATNSSVAQLVGGVVAGRVLFQASASASGIGISIASGSGRRRIEVTSTASQAGGRTIVSKAVVDIANDSSRTVTLDSWYSRAD